MRSRFAILIFVINIFLFSCKTEEKNTTDNQPLIPISEIDTTGANTSELSDIDSNLINSSFIKDELKRIKVGISNKIPIILRTDVNENLDRAQKIAILDSSFQQYLFESNTKKAIRNEIFGIYPARQSDYNIQTSGLCSDGSCYRVEMYNYGLNTTTVALVSLTANKVISSYLLPYTQPDISPILKQLALKIAVESSLVQKALGYKADQKDAIMSDTKTALNKTKCERSRHLCVAPTFVKGNKALWAIVDLTDLKLVGVRWTNVGNVPIVTERKIQNEKLTECYCKTVNKLVRNGWDLDYMLTSSDGLRISDVKYNGKVVFLNAKLVDWHVSYSNTDGFGYSDAVGCPYFSNAAVVAIESPKIKTLLESGKEVGFTLEQFFYSEGWPQPCNYNYLQRFEFYNDGRVRVSCASLGRGCGNNGTYRPVMRIALAGNDNTFSEWKENNWSIWDKEKWNEQNPKTQYTTEGYQYKYSGVNGGFFIEPGRGQFNDKGRGDNAYTFVTLSHPEKDEGESDLVTIGPCCNSDYHQGPEKFIEPSPENIQNKTLVLWYVGQMKNDDT